MTLDPELQAVEQIKISVDGITTAVQNDLVREHNLDQSKLPNIKSSLFVGYTQEQMVASLAEMGLQIEGGLPPACVFTLPYEQGATEIEQVVWFDAKHPFIKGLKDFTDYNFERHQPGFLIVAEEISHFLYKSQYFQRHGVEPPEWMIEMIGALDKYTLLQKKYIDRYGRPMNPQQDQTSRRMIFTALDSPPGAPPEHGIGHSYAYNVVGTLNRLSSTGKQNEASALFNQLYTGNESTVKQMLPQVRHMGSR